MRPNALFAIALGLSVAASAQAGEVAGVKMPDSITVEGKALKLNGMGIRKKLMFKVYVCALYLEAPSNDAAAIVSSDQIKRVRLHILRDLKASQVSDAIKEGFERNAKETMAALRERLNRFSTMFSDVAEGDEILFTYVPGKGTSVNIKGAEKGVVEGKDFASALLLVWVGPRAIQEDLRKALLGV